MIKAIITDDDNSCIEALAALLKKHCPQVAVVGFCNSTNEAVKLIAEHAPHIVFLDVEMNGEFGFDLLKKIPVPNFEIVFTTAHEKYALQAIKTSCLEYLLKPIDAIELQTAVLKFEKNQQLVLNQKKIEVLLANISSIDNSITKIMIPSHDAHTFLDTNEIICCEADMNYTNVFTNKGEKIVSTKNLKEFEETLNPKSFFRCHKSWLINTHFIKKFMKSDSQVLMTNDMLIDISVRKKEEFLNLFKKF